MEEPRQNRADKVFALMRRVNLRATCALLVFALSCGPTPRAIPAFPPSDDARAQLPAAPRVVWRRDIGSGLLAPLEARGEALFATTTNRAVVALAHESGRRFWNHRFGGAITTGIRIDGDRLFFATEDVNGSAHALEASRGRRIWSQKLGASRTHPLVLDQRVIFGTESGWVYALQTADGAVAWRTRVMGAVVIPPVAYQSTITVATAADTVYALDATNGSILNRARLAAAPSAAVLARGDTLVLPLQDGSVIGLQARTLQPLRQWRVGEPVLAKPVEIEGTVFVLSRAGEVWRLGANGADRVAALGAAARGALTAVGNRLLIGLLDGRVVAMDPTGTILWEFRAPRSVAAPATAVGNALFVPLLNGEVLKIQ